MLGFLRVLILLWMTVYDNKKRGDFLDNYKILEFSAKAVGRDLIEL